MKVASVGVDVNAVILKNTKNESVQLALFPQISSGKFFIQIHLLLSRFLSVESQIVLFSIKFLKKLNSILNKKLGKYNRSEKWVIDIRDRLSYSI